MGSAERGAMGGAPPGGAATRPAWGATRAAPTKSAIVPICRAEALRVRLALRVDDLLELAQHPHAGQHLLQAGIGGALFGDGGDELAVLELDAVHGDVDLR